VRNPWKRLSKVNPQAENGFRRISTEVYNALLKFDLTGAEFRVCLCLIGHTWGWDKTEDVIPIRQFVDETGLSERAVKYALKSLKVRRVIHFEPSDRVHRGSPLNVYLFNKHWDTWTEKTVQKSARTEKGAEIVKKGCKELPELVQRSVRKSAGDGKATTIAASNHAGESSPKEILQEKHTTENEIENSSNKSDHSKLVAYWCRRYEDTYGHPYDFKDGKDGRLVKRLLNRFGFDVTVQLVDALFESDDEFYNAKTGGGRTIGVLTANSNKLIQMISSDKSQMSRFSKTTQRSIANLSRALESMEAKGAK